MFVWDVMRKSRFVLIPQLAQVLRLMFNEWPRGISESSGVMKHMKEQIKTSRQQHLHSDQSSSVVDTIDLITSAVVVGLKMLKVTSNIFQR